MDTTAVVTITDVANIVTLVAPGYFAIKVYAVMYAKREKDFSRLLIESVACSLPIVAAANWIWHDGFRLHAVPSSLTPGYALFLLGLSVLAGAASVWLRSHAPLVRLAGRLGLGSPDEDFIRAQFKLLSKVAKVTVTLKSGEIFSGRPVSGSTYDGGSPQRYYFSDIAWYDAHTGKWDNRPGGLILDLDEVEYIETPEAVQHT